MTLKLSLNESFKNQYPEGHNKVRQVTGLRSVLKNIKDIDTNYKIDGGLNWSDVYSRLYFKEYAQWNAGDSAGNTVGEITKGWFRNIKLFKVLRGETTISKKTRILELRETGNADNVRDIVLTHVIEAIKNG